MRRENYWQPALEPILLSLYNYLGYHFEACANTIWATTGISEFLFPSAKKIIFCNLEKRAIKRPYNFEIPTVTQILFP